MDKPRIYIDGQEGTTGLRIRQMLESRRDLKLLLIPPQERKNPRVRAEFLVPAESLAKVAGQPFHVEEIRAAIDAALRKDA